MTDKICFDTNPILWTQPDPVCEAEAVTLAPARPALEPAAPLAANPARITPLWRSDSPTWRRGAVASAFTSLGRPAPLPGAETSALAYGALAVLPTGCSNADAPESSDDGGGSSGEDAPRPDAGTPMSTPVPSLEGFEVHALTPCGSQGFITDLDESIGVCANPTTGQHHLFSWNSSSGGSAASIVALPFLPDQAVRGSNGEIYITTYGTAGLAVVNPVESVSSSVGFPGSIPLSGLSSSGRSISSVSPGFPKGLVEIDGRLFIATSNFDPAHSDFLPGTVLNYDRATGNFDWLETSGYNPTGVANANGTLLVVSSGAIDRFGVATTEAFLDAFDPVSGEKLHSLSLGISGAGLSGDLALSQDGSVLVLPTADNSGRLLVINLLSFSKREVALRPQGMTGDPALDRIFIPAVQLSPDGSFAVVGNYNDGRAYGVDLRNDLLSPTALSLDSDLTDTLGVSDGLQIGGEYFVGVGSEILRLRLH